MYFRFPVLLLMIFALLFGVFYFKIKSDNNLTFANNLPAPSDSLTSTANGALQSIRADQLRAHLEFLADDLLEGRDTGSRGARLAALYLASQFERMGLKPVGDHRSFFQAVPLLWQRVSPNSKLSVEVNGGMVPLTYGRDFLVANVGKEGEGITREMVFSGFGIRAPEYNYDDFKNVDVKGKFSVSLSGEPPSEDETFFAGSRPTKYSSGLTKRDIIRNLKADGMIGVILPETLEQYNWSAFQNFFGGERISLLNNKTGGDDFCAFLVHYDAAGVLFSNTPKSFDEIKNGAAKGTVSSFEMKKKVQVQIFIEEKKIADRNVMAFLEGADPVLKSEVVVYSAHYDHIGVGTPAAGDSVYNGAADNASGVAGLLEVAEAFSLLPQPPRRSILFLAVTGEEKGLLGSEYYVEHPIFPISKTVANFNFDMIGLGDSTGLVVYGSDRSSLGSVIEQSASRFKLKILPDDLPEENIYYRSDHYSFAKKGVPAIFPSFGINRASLAEFNKFYHQPNDDIHLPFNYNYMKKHAQVLFLAGLLVANADTPPKWTPGDEFEKARAAASE